MRTEQVRFNESGRSMSDEAIRNIVRRSRGSDFRSTRGFGRYQHKKNEFAPGISAQRDGWFYDTVSFGAGAAFATTLMFQTPQSGAKLLNSTNLTGQGGQLPAGTTLVIYRMRVSISNLAVPADYANIISNVTFEFKVNNVPIYQCIPDFFPAGFGAVTYSAANVGTVPAGSAALTSTNNGLPTQNATYEFQYPYSLASQENFNVVLTPQSAFNLTAASAVNPLGVGVTIRIYLDGVKQQNVTS
jgi:hypothetical protein